MRSTGKQDLVNLYAQAITLGDAGCSLMDINFDGSDDLVIINRNGELMSNIWGIESIPLSEKKIQDFISSGIEWLPTNTISLNKEKTKSVLNFLETLEDDDDVQHVYANLEINNNFAAKIST